jgi:hypothetical protein
MRTWSFSQTPCLCEQLTRRRTIASSSLQESKERGESLQCSMTLRCTVIPASVGPLTLWNDATGGPTCGRMSRTMCVDVGIVSDIRSTIDQPKHRCNPYTPRQRPSHSRSLPWTLSLSCLPLRDSTQFSLSQTIVAPKQYGSYPVMRPSQRKGQPNYFCNRCSVTTDC